MAKIIDLTHPIHTGMPLYPGSPPLRVEPLASLPGDGFAETLLTLSTHTGTHVDAPAHMIPGAKSLDRYPAERFVGRAIVVDLCDAPPDGEVTLADLEPRAARLNEGIDFLLLRTGFSRHWGTPAYFQGYPVLSTEAARWLAGLSLKGVGIDAISFDREGDEAYPNHRILLGRDILLLENLTNLDQLPAAPFLLSALPLPLAEADGAPVRAVATVG